MSDLGKRVEAVMEASTYCLSWCHPSKDLELTHEEFDDLLMEKSAVNHLLRRQTSTTLTLWGVNIVAVRYPRRSVLRTKYLHAINPTPWIDELARRMERYA